MPSWIWQRWHHWFYDYEFSEEILPEQLSGPEPFPRGGGDGYLVGISEEDMAAVKSDLDHLLEVANGEVAVALIMAAYHFNAVVSYITRMDVERVLGHAISEVEWLAMKEQLNHFDEHIMSCHAPLVQAFIRNCYDSLHAVENWREHPLFQPLREAVANRRWHLIG